MGRQIGFYMRESEERAFLDFVLSDVNVVPLIDCQLTEEYGILDRINENEHSYMWGIYFWNKAISSPPGVRKLTVIDLGDRYFLETGYCELIEFSRTTKDQESFHSESCGGRIYIPTSYLSEDETELIKCSEPFIKWYESLVKWLKKRFVGKYKHPIYGDFHVMQEAADFLTQLGHEVIFKK